MNAFEAFADQHTAAPIKARQRVAAKRAEALERRRQATLRACVNGADGGGRNLLRYLPDHTGNDSPRQAQTSGASVGRHRCRRHRRRLVDSRQDTQTLVRRVVSAFIMCKRDERRT
jgi:hypothetical protein